MDFSFESVCFALEQLIGVIPTILTIALVFGLLALASGLTVLVLWKSFSWGARFAMLRSWLKLEAHVRRTAEWYFERLKWYGLRKITCKIAVVCSFVVYLAILTGFAFHNHWKESVVLVAAVLIGFFVVGWLKKGDSAGAAPIRFARGFYEPTLVLGIPTLFTKCLDMAIRAIAGGL